MDLIITICMLIVNLQIVLKPDFYLPIQVKNRTDWSLVKLTSIGQYRLVRKSRPEVPQHLHTGIDFARPSDNYKFEPIFPVYNGTVISIRDDGPFAQIIIQHKMNNLQFWTVYEHVSGIKVSIGDEVNPANPIARFMNRNELDRFGYQFDHFHFEVLKNKPLKIHPAKKLPQRQYSAPTLTCYSETDLMKNYYNPELFLLTGKEK